jgi:hypothetical protein
MKRITLLTGLSLALNLAALAAPKLAVFGVLIGIIALAAGGRDLPEDARRMNRWVGSIALLLSGIMIFAAREAVPGIAEARARDGEQRAVSRLRELLFAEDAMRKLAALDPDRDQVGSAAFLSELTGATPLRNGQKLAYPPLESRLQPRVLTPHGPALLEGEYLFYLCLPVSEERYTASLSDRVHDELAERHWLGFAWPRDPKSKNVATLAIDQDERIWKSRTEAPRWAGPSSPPPCDPKLPENPSLFETWRKKRPRAELPYAN